MCMFDPVCNSYFLLRLLLLSVSPSPLFLDAEPFPASSVALPDFLQLNGFGPLAFFFARLVDPPACPSLSPANRLASSFLRFLADLSFSRTPATISRSSFVASPPP